MKNKRIIAILTVIVAAVFGMNPVAQAQDTAATETTYTIEASAIVQSGNIIRTVSATGTISPIQEVTLSFQTQSSVVTEILVAEGERVQAGDIIARVASRSYEENLADAQFQLESAQIAYNDLTGVPRDVDVAAAEASVRSAQLALGPGTPLTGPDSAAAQIENMEYELALNARWQQQMRYEDFDAGLDPAWMRMKMLEEGTDEWENALQDFYEAQARVVMNESEVRVVARGVDVARAEYDAELNRRATYAGSSNAYAQLTEAEIRLEDLVGPPDPIDLAYAEIDVAMAQLNLEYVQELGQQAVLVAPFDGIVAELNLTLGVIPPADAVVLVNDAAYEIIVPVDELDIARVDVGEAVSIELDALPDAALSGIVDNVALTPTLRGDVVTYNVRIALNASDVALRSGMSGRAWIAVESVAGALYVPSQFVRTVESLDANVVVVQKQDNTIELRRVNVGIVNATQTQLLSGVSMGETVVLLPTADLERLVLERAQSSNVTQQ